VKPNSLSEYGYTCYIVVLFLTELINRKIYTVQIVQLRNAAHMLLLDRYTSVSIIQKGTDKQNPRPINYIYPVNTFFVELMMNPYEYLK